MSARLLGWALAYLSLSWVCCGPDPGNRSSPSARDAPVPRQAAASPQALGEWIVIEDEEFRELGEGPVYRQGPEPPRLLERRAVVLPVPPEQVPAAPILLQAVVTGEGRVTKFRVLRSPPLPLGTDVRDARIVEALQRVRFAPARLRGEPVPVYFSMSLEIEGESAR